MLDITKGMSKKQKEQREINLQGLSNELKEVTVDKENVFYKYCEKNLVGKEIIDAFLKYNEEKTGKKNAFIFSDDIQEVGILSELQGFQTVLALIEQFKLDPNDYPIVDMLDVIFEMLNAKEDTSNIIFDLTPFLPEAEGFKDGKKAYLDTVTWTISAMLSVFRIYIDENGFEFPEEQINKAVKVYRRAMNYLGETFINGDIENREFDCGWNYSEGSTKPSLYFVFAVSEVLIDIYTTFTSAISHYEINYVQEHIEEVFKELVEKAEDEHLKEELLEEKELKKQKIVADNIENVKRFNAKDDPSAVRERKLFERLNSTKTVTDPYGLDAPYQVLEANVKQAANDIWNIVKDKISSSFFSYNLKPIDDELIEQSASSDALFNSVFIINTVINAGLDEDLDDQINFFTHSDSPEYNDALEQYDDLLNALKISFEHTNQIYTELVKKNKEYKVDEFSITLDEEFPRQLIDEVREIRKAHIRVFSLMPLISKTKTLMSDFVIKYPQYDMQIFLEKILKYRLLDEKGNYMWIWEGNGYSSSSNYYFVTALGSFFSYYEKYERDFIENSNDNEERKKEIREAHLKELKKEGNEIGNLNKDIETLKAERDALKKKLDSANAEVAELKSDPLREALQGFIMKTLEENFYPIMTKMLLKSQEELERSVFNPNEEESYDGCTAFGDQFKKFILALLSVQMLESLKENECRPEIYPGKQKEVAADFNEVIKIYLSQIIKRGGSAYTENDGFIDFASMSDIIKDKKGKE